MDIAIYATHLLAESRDLTQHETAAVTGTRATWAYGMEACAIPEGTVPLNWRRG